MGVTSQRLPATTAVHPVAPLATYRQVKNLNGPGPEPQRIQVKTNRRIETGRVTNERRICGETELTKQKR